MYSAPPSEPSALLLVNEMFPLNSTAAPIALKRSWKIHYVALTKWYIVLFMCMCMCRYA